MQLIEQQQHTVQYFSITHTMSVSALFSSFLFCLKAKHRVSSYSQLLKMEKDYIFFPSKKGE